MMNRLYTGLSNKNEFSFRLSKTSRIPIIGFAERLVTFSLLKLCGEGGAHLFFVIFAHFQLRRILA